jgi:Tol biopolymer transport system component
MAETMNSRRLPGMTTMHRTAPVLLAASVLLAAPHGATAITLNDPLVPGGQVCRFLLTPDGSSAVYQADQETNQMTELYAVPLGGGTVTKLNEPLIPGGRIRPLIAVTPDGSRVLYEVGHHQDTHERELYSVAIGGGPVTKLNGPLMENDYVAGFWSTPDSTRVVFAVSNISATEPATAAGLYAVGITGGPVTRLTPPRTGNSAVGGAEIGPGGDRVVYSATADVFDAVWELYSVPVDGGPVTKLNGPLVPGGRVHHSQITADGRRVVYAADQDTEVGPELYAVPIDGGPATRLAGPIGGDVQITPDGSRVVYRAERSVFSVPVAGGVPARLDAPLREDEALIGFRLTPDGSRVVYLVAWSVEDGYPDWRKFLSVPVEGGPAVELTDFVPAHASVGFGTFQISPDGSRVFYRVSGTSRQLYSVPTTGGPPTRLTSSSVYGFRITADSRRVVYAVRTGTVSGVQHVFDLYTVAATGGPVVKLAGGVRADLHNRPLQIAPDSRRVLFVAGPATGGATELHELALPVFSDVAPAHPFAPWIEALMEAGIAAGCAAEPPLYCPDAPVTRAQLAIFLVRALLGPGASPPPPTGTVFTDVPVDAFAAAWIEELTALGLTAGCAADPPLYCPRAAVTRGQSALFLLRARHGTAYEPPPATGTMFVDVPASHPFGAWIEQLAREGITAGCATGPARFCPDAPTTRGQIAVFLVEGLGLER